MKQVWAVFPSLIALIIAIAVFHKAGSDYEKIAFSLLVMIYLRIAVFEAWNHITFFEGIAAIGKDLWKIMIFLQEIKDGKEHSREEYEVKTAKAEKDMDEMRLRAHIETGISSITFFIALYHLVRGLRIF